MLVEVNKFVQRYRGSAAPPVDLALHTRFNPNLEQSWFGALVEIINNVAIHHPQNRLQAHVEFSERAKEKTLSYSTIEKTFFSTFIRKDPLFTPMNLRLKIGENPREKQQLVELMNIIALSP